jgi:hypothetical protein
MGKFFICFLAYKPPNWQAPNFTYYESIDVNFGACQFEGVCLVCCGVQANFYHKFLIPNHPLHQSRIFLMV